MTKPQSQVVRGGKGTDWNKLFTRLARVYEAAGKDRQKAVLDNHLDQKETICRRLNVVCEADVDRIAQSLGQGRKT